MRSKCDCYSWSLKWKISNQVFNYFAKMFQKINNTFFYKLLHFRPSLRASPPTFPSDCVGSGRSSVRINIFWLGALGKLEIGEIIHWRVIPWTCKIVVQKKAFCKGMGLLKLIVSHNQERHCPSSGFPQDVVRLEYGVTFTFRLSGADFPLFSVLVPPLCAFHPVFDGIIMLATVSQFR